MESFENIRNTNSVAKKSVTSAPRKSRGLGESRRSSSLVPRLAASSSKKKNGGGLVGLHMRDTDILTGKKITQVFFNPDEAIELKGKQTTKEWRDMHMFEPAGVVEEDQTLNHMTLRLGNGEIVKMNAAGACKVTEKDGEGVPDILKLRDFSEMSLIHTLRTRYTRDEIYTFVGPILISINPYKWFKDLYSEQTMITYNARKRGDLPPHLFVVADSAYQALMKYARGEATGPVKNQSIIISGESGAGKTEATKVIMTFLARITMGGATNTVGKLEQKVLNTNPMLEAFGNAKTLRNDNSSRFGKFIKIQFSDTGRIVGASMEKYLLEKTRVIGHKDGERNFHIFYQMLRGSSTEDLAALDLVRDTEEYSIVSCDGSSSEIPKVSDSREFHLTRDCMKSVGIDEGEQMDILSLLAGILHIGNLEFFDKDDEAVINELTPKGKTHVESAAKLFGVSPEKLLNVLTKQNIHVGGSTIVKFVSTVQSNDKRDSFAKSVYSMIFNWLFQKINDTIAVRNNDTWGVIGVLDIYGFENFDQNNGFEQLLINYANEKLQSHFNKHIFSIEQQEYASEGIDWSYVHFNDNQSCVELIDGKPEGKPGIFAALDDSLNFLAQLNQQFAGGTSAGGKSHPEYISPRFNSDKRFGVAHYAGEVMYEIEGFSEKNRDSTNHDMKELMAGSTIKLLGSIAAEVMKKDVAMAAGSSPSNSTSGGGSSRNNKPGRNGSFQADRRMSVNKLREDSISKQFAASLSSLYDMLSASEPHYVRCIKPNGEKIPETLMSTPVLEQLKNAGMMETIRIRQKGFATRSLHTEFFAQYSPLLPRCRNLTELVTQLSTMLTVGDDSWQVGKSKVFLRATMSDKLDRLLRVRFTQSARRIQAFWRHEVCKRAALRIQKIMRRFLVSVKFQRIRSFAIMNQSMLRMYSAWLRYQQVRGATQFLQRMVRGHAGRKIAREHRNPYNHMDYAQLSEEISKLEAELSVAMANKQFGVCEGIHTRIAAAESAREKQPIPEVVPESRAHLELLISAGVFAISHSKSLNNVSTIARLQDHQARLEGLRASFPAVNEMRQQLSECQGQLDAAMARKDFRQCAALNSKIAILEEQLSDPANSRGAGQSIAQLKQRASDLEADMTTAVQQKHFERCASLQKELDSVQEHLAVRDVSSEAAQLRLCGLETVMQTELAAHKQDYMQLAALQGDIDQLQLDLKCIQAAEAEALAVAQAQAEAEAIAKAEAEAGALAKAEAEALAKAEEERIADEAEALAQAQAEAEALAKAEEERIAAEAEAQAAREEEERRIAEEEAIEAAAAAKAEAMAAREEEERRIAEEEAAAKEAENKLTKPEIQEKMAETSKALEAALAGKRYQECDTLQAEMDHLTELRDKIPTAASVLMKMQECEKELKECISNKTFSKCEGIEAQIEHLKAQHEVLAKEELSMMPPPPAFKPKPTSHTPAKAAPAALLDESASSSIRPSRKGTAADKKVAKLRPRAPITESDSATIHEVAALMAHHRVDAALLLNDNGVLTGIITDNDITRRVVNKFVDPTITCVSDVMTAQPKCVCTEDSALDALEMMVENRFRHLPVLDDSGCVVGVLDIAKCLYEAISALEHVQESEESKAPDADNMALVGAMANAMQKAGGSKNKAQMAAMQQLMESMFGGSMPTLRTIIGKEHYISVRSSTNVREAADVMAQARKGVLVVDDGELVGIFTPKDMLSRVIAKGLSPDVTAVSSVMTPNPDCVSPDLTILDALREMHDHKFLHLPVRDEDGTVLGLVDVMELVCNSAGGDGKGWRDFFSGAMDVKGNESFNDSMSIHSRDSSIAANVTASRMEEPKVAKKVAKLRPKAPITLSVGAMVQEVAEAMASKRSDAALILEDNGNLAGILTDNDITRRVVNKFVDPTITCVSDVMTAQPKCVCTEDSALDALEMMVENRFRHLPVLDDSGCVVGVLDIAKCLYEAISALEHVQESEESKAPDADNMALVGAMANAMQKAGGSKNKAQMAAMQQLMESMFGGSMPTLRTIIGKEHYISVRSSTNVREAADVMAQARKGVLVVDDGELVGIFTPKDMLSRVIAKGLSPDVTAVSSVMTPNPDCVSPDLTILDALREMHDHKFLHLPVRDEDGTVLGLVDVMELVCNSAGGDGKGWRDFFSGAMDAHTMNRGGDDTFSEISSNHSASIVAPSISMTKSQRMRGNGTYHNMMDETSSDVFSISVSGVHHTDNRMNDSIMHGNSFVFKITDTIGQTHRIKTSSVNFDVFIEAIAEKMECAMECLCVRYTDDDGDEITISSTQALQEAVEFARGAGLTALKLSTVIVDAPNESMVVPPAEMGDVEVEGTNASNNRSIIAEEFEKLKTDKNRQFALGAGVAVTAVILTTFMVMLRPKK